MREFHSSREVLWEYVQEAFQRKENSVAWRGYDVMLCGSLAFKDMDTEVDGADVAWVVFSRHIGAFLDPFESQTCFYILKFI